MEEQNESIYVPVPEESFRAGKTELFCALLMYVTAYLYIRSAIAANSEWLCTVVAGLLLLFVELMNRGKKAPAESVVWFGCFAGCVCSLSFGLSRVWDEFQLSLFVHGFCVWWVLSRSGALLEGESGHLLPADGFNGLIRIPFGNFFLRLRTLRFAAKARKKGKGGQGKRFVWVLLAALLCAVLFIQAAKLLSAADSDFGSLLENVLSWFSWEISENVAINILYIVLSIPVGCWLYGLIGGSCRVDGDAAERQRGGIYAFLKRIRKVPCAFWCAVAGAFTLLYGVFFFVQGSYLFGAFTRTLPEGFIVSQYARQGFFELCRVMAVNFAVLWLMTRMADEGARGKRIFNVLCAALLAESMVFAVIAFSKLALYISCFGFTPKRFQSTWLVCVLFAGCLCWMVAQLTGKKTFRKWMVFSAVTLSALALV